MPASRVEPTVTTVVLRRLPLRLWRAAEQHHDTLLRELMLYRAEHPGEPDASGPDLPLALDAQAALAEAILEAVGEEQAADSSADREICLTGDLAAMFGALQDCLDEAERLTARGRLLARPGLAEIVAVRDWLCEQAMAQLHGVPPAPWLGSEHEAFTRADRGRFAIEPPDWDARPVLEATDCQMAADDNDRLVAVSGPAAELTGWSAEDLVGRRIVTIIPPRLREAHVVGFTRHLTTGEAHVLDRPVNLPVLRADGSEVTCQLHISRAAGVRGGAVYVARFMPVAAP